MKSMTYAQKADLVAKCKRVFESVKRSNQVAMAESYNDLAVKCIGGEYQLASNLRLWASEMHSRIKNKPRYRYDNRAGEWVESGAYQERLKSLEIRRINKLKIDSMLADAEYKMLIEKARFEQRNALANSYAEEQRRAMAAAQNTLSVSNGFMAGVNPLTGW